MKKALRTKILDQANDCTTNQRNKVYGDPKVNYTHTAALLTAYFKDKSGYIFSSEDAAMIQCLVKISRIAGGKFKDDNYIDLAAYAAIAGECAND